MAHLALALLGPFKATLNGEPILPTAGRLQALLAYLATEAPREHSRQAVARLLWPHQSDGEARTSLRYALSHLHRALQDRHADQPFLSTTRHTAQFNRDSDHRLDVDEFQALLDGPERVETLQAALRLYRGPFLEGFALDDSPAFEEWQLLHQERFRRRALVALERLATLHELRGEYGPAAATIRRHLALDPWDENAHRHLMRVLALDGHRSAALAQYDVCRQVLAQELGVELEDQTVALCAQIRSGTLPAPMGAGVEIEDDSQAPLPTLTPRSATPFVARERELSRMDAFLQAARNGRGGVVFVTGEAGSGKTALLHEFARREMLAAQDLLCATGRGAAQAGVGDPFLPFRELLQTLAGVAPGSLPGIDGVLSARRAEALPAVRAALVDAGPALLDTLVPGRALLERHQEQETLPSSPEALFQQTYHTLHRVAERYPLLLMLDDLQWADPGTVSLLFHLGRRIRDSRILIAGAYRPAGVARDRDGRPHPLAPVVREFQREWGEIVIELDRGANRAFVDAYLDSEPNALDDEFREQLHRVTEGHALFTVELVRSLRERGHLTRDATGRWVCGSPLDGRAMPPRVEAVIAQRINRLPDKERTILEVAGVQGETFEAEVVARALGADGRTILNVLADSLGRRQQLVQAVGLHRTATGQRLSRYRFRHVLFQHYLYQTLDAAQRASLHEAVGRAMEALYAGEEEPAPRLAYHFERAGLLERAAGYRLTAGRRAYRLSAHEEAIAHYRRGLSLLDRLPEATIPSRRVARLRRQLALHLALGAPLEATQGWANPAQVETYERAYQLAHRLAHHVEMDPQFLKAFYLQIKVATGRGAYRQAEHLAQQLQALGRRSDDPLALGLAHWALGISHFVQGRCPAAREHLEETLALYRRRPSRFPLLSGVDVGVNCLSWLSLTLCTLGYPEQALHRADQALALARQLDLPPSLGMALALAGCTVPAYCRQRDVVHHHARELSALAREKGLALYRAWAEIPLGWCMARAGAFEEGSARMRRGIDAWERMGTVPGQFFHLTLLAEVYDAAGEADRGMETIEEALTLVEETGVCNHEPEIHRVRGELLRARDVREAEACFRRAIVLARRQGARWWELRATVSLARLWRGREAARGAEARGMLTEICGGFSEGDALPDLRAARTLIEELAPPADGPTRRGTATHRTL
jgi:adenylate cyclase